MTHVSNNTAAARFAFDNTYARELEDFYVAWKAAQVAQPKLVKLNRELAEELRLDTGALDSEEGARIFAGNATPEGAAPLGDAARAEPRPEGCARARYACAEGAGADRVGAPAGALSRARGRTRSSACAATRSASSTIDSPLSRRG